MNRRKARKLAHSDTHTIGSLRELLTKSPTSGQSIINDQLTKRQAIDIFSKAIAGRSDDEILKTVRWQDGRSTRDCLLITNILREVG